MYWIRLCIQPIWISDLETVEHFYILKKGVVAETTSTNYFRTHFPVSYRCTVMGYWVSFNTVKIFCNKLLGLVQPVIIQT